MLESFHPGTLPDRLSFATDNAGPVMLTAVKGAEDDTPRGDLIVRAVETTGRTGRARIELPLLGRVIEADFGPSQIRTFRVPADGGQVRETDLIEWDLAADAPPAERRPIRTSPMPATPGGEDPAVPDPESSHAALPAERTAPAQSRNHG
jgi:alpha-mannosidase